MKKSSHVHHQNTSPRHRLWVGFLAIVFVALFAAGLAITQMYSIYNYRSPLNANPPAPGAPSGQPLTRRLVLVLLDGLREDTSLRPEVMPFLNELRALGGWATMHSRPPSVSSPGFSILVTGAWQDLNGGPVMNPLSDEFPAITQETIFAAVHGAGLRTGISGYSWLKLIPPGAVDAGFNYAGEDESADRQVLDAALPWLDSQDYQFVLIHIDQIDDAGHNEGGPLDPRWDAAASRSDEMLREIVSHLDLGLDTIMVVSDHGHIDRGGHGGPEPAALTEPFVMAGAGVRPGQYPDMQMADIAPTIAAMFGANIPAASQGHVLTGMLVLSDEQQADIQIALTDQQAQLEQRYIAAIGGQPVEVLLTPGQDVVDSYQHTMEAARQARLLRERILRAAVALCLVAAAVILLLKKGREVLWLLAGGLLCAALFHLLYAVPTGRTYSFSWITTPASFILTVLLFSFLAFLPAWLLVAFGRGAFRQGSPPAAQVTLDLSLTTALVLALPVLWNFILNGFYASWTLPEFWSMFVSLLALMQIMFTMVIGQILAGLGALIAHMVEGRNK